jgi:hypothetical protein
MSMFRHSRRGPLRMLGHTKRQLSRSNEYLDGDRPLRANGFNKAIVSLTNASRSAFGEGSYKGMVRET